MIVLKKTYDELYKKYHAATEEIASLKADMAMCGKYADKVWFLQVELKKRSNAVEDYNSLSKIYEASIKESREIISNLKKKAETLTHRLSSARLEYRRLITINNTIHLENKVLRKKFASITGKLGASAKKNKKTNLLGESNKQFLGRFYWPSMKYCTIQPQPIL